MSIPELPKFYRDAHLSGSTIPEEAWRDSYPIGEVPADEYTALRGAESKVLAAVEKVGLDIWRDRDEVVAAAKELRRRERAGVDQDSDVWVDAMQRLRDAVDRLPIVLSDGGAS